MPHGKVCGRFGAGSVVACISGVEIIGSVASVSRVGIALRMMQPDLFDAPVSPVNRRFGHQMAERTTILARMLALYAIGPRTDAEMARALSTTRMVERTTVIARRDELMKLGKVKDLGYSRKNAASGKPNTVWGLV